MTAHTIPIPNAVAPKTGGDFKGGHYYGHENGLWVPLYEPEKDFTLRQARKLHAEGKVAVPSVTTYMGIMNKPQLNKWGQENVAKACWAQKEGFGGTEEEWIDKALATASGASRGAMDLGTRIHKADELAATGQEYDADLDVYVQAIAKARAELGLKASHREECMGSLKYGVGGRCDEWTDCMAIIDLKSRKSKGKKVASYETDPIQLACYGFCKWGNAFFKQGRGVIIAISTTNPGLVTVHQWAGTELVQAFEAFLSMTAVWRYINNCDPRKP